MKPRRMRIGISSCLLGNEVRWNGAHKRDLWVTDSLGRFVEWVAVCPEVDMGLLVPRESMSLMETGGSIRLTGNNSHTNYTKTLRDFAAHRVANLYNVCGYILKSGSPSCGLAGVKVFGFRGKVLRKERGLYAAALLYRNPCLPIIEETALACPKRRENFIRKIFTWRRWQSLVSSGATLKKIRRFHEQHRYLIMAYSRAGLERLESIEKPEAYFNLLFKIFRRAPSARNQAYVLSCLCGRLDLPSRETGRVKEKIEKYIKGALPLIEPLGLIRRYVEKKYRADLRGQVYLFPHPDEWQLLSGIKKRIKVVS